MDDALIGRCLGGRYEIEEKIGEGGMAVVYRGKDTLLDRLVAIKVLRDQFASDTEFLTRFRMEARSAASLSHAHVVHIFDVGEDDGKHFIVMEFVAGINLKEKIRHFGPLDAKTATRISIQIAHALEAAHQRGLIHRDIKPHNILITSDNQVKVTDFGIARAASAASFTQTGTVIGSVHYFSPEQARGDRVDQSTDLYSLGVVMYEMLTGRLPFVGENPVAVALKHLEKSPVPPSRLGHNVPAKLEHIVMKLLAKQPRERFRDVVALRQALLALYPSPFEEGEPTEQNIGDFSPEYRPKPHSSDEALDATKVFSGVDDFEQTRLRREENTMSDRSTRQKRRRWVLIPVFLLFFAGAALATMILPNIIFPAEVEVPYVIGLDVPEARSELAAAGLRLIEDGSVVSSTVEAGKILHQEPEPWHRVRKGREIKVLISRGPEKTIVPNLTDLPKIEAQLMITRERLTLGEIIEQYAPDKLPNTVIGQDPEPGVEATAGLPVDIVVARGSLPQSTVTMPDVKGMTLDEAKRMLHDLGLAEGQLHGEPHPTAAPNEVIDQNPPPGDEVEVGYPYALAYAVRRTDESADAGGSLEPTDDKNWENRILIQVPDGPAREVVIVVVDDWGPRQVFRDVRRGGSRFYETVRLRGDRARIQVWFDGEEQMNEELRRPMEAGAS